MVPRRHGALRPYPTCPAALSLQLCGTALGAALERERRDSLVLELWEQASLSPKPSCLDSPSVSALTSPQVSLARFASRAHPEATTGENRHDWLGQACGYGRKWAD